MGTADRRQQPPRVFISYSHDGPAHADRVLQLAYALERDGVAVALDQFVGESLVDWPRWCAERLDPAHTDFVLMVCTAEYRRRIENQVALDIGRGLFWEGNLIYGALYRAKANERFVPLLLDGASQDSLPAVVANWTCFRLRAFGLDSGDPGYEQLYRLLTRQPATPRPERGAIRRLPPRPMPSAGSASWPQQPGERAQSANRPITKPINLPYASLRGLFKGRDALLAELRAGFLDDSDPSRDPSSDQAPDQSPEPSQDGPPTRAQVIVPRHAIHGLGGIGKTRAAVEYAWRHAASYRALLFVSAASPANLDAGLAALCGLLGLARDVTEQPERVRAALGWLADTANAGWLLIVDNLDTPEAAVAVERTLAGLTGGHLLVTGRLDRWPADMRTRRVDVLDDRAAQALLLERTGGHRQAAGDDPDQALALARELGGLALALEQAAACIASRRLGLLDYRRRWQAADAKVLQWHDARTMHYQRPLAATWQASIDALPPAACALLDLLAWLAPAPLPRFLFDHAAAPAGTEALFADRPDPAAVLRELCGGDAADSDPEDALAALRALSLLQPTAESAFASEGQVHQVLALIARERQTGAARAAALKAALALVDAAAVGEPDDVRSWPVWEPLRPHVAVLADHAEAASVGEPTARLLHQLGLFLATKAQHVEAEPLMRRALAIDEASYGAEHPNVAIRLNNLAQLLQATNRLGEAEPLSRRMVLIVLSFTRKTGHHHPHLGVGLDNYRGLLRAMDLDQAEQTARIASLGSEAGFGEDEFRELLEAL